MGQKTASILAVLLVGLIIGSSAYYVLIKDTLSLRLQQYFSLRETDLLFSHQSLLVIATNAPIIATSENIAVNPGRVIILGVSPVYM